MSSSKSYMSLLGFFSAEPSNSPCAIFPDDGKEKLKEHWKKMQILEEILIIERISCLIYCFSVHLFGSRKK